MLSQIKNQRRVVVSPITLLTSTYALFSIVGTSALVLSSAYTVVFYLMHVGYAEIGLLFAVFTIGKSILDYPTGTLADTIGTKKVLLLAYGSYAVSWIVLYSSTSLAGFMLAILIMAFGESQLTGTLNAWYTNKYKSLNGDLDVIRSKYGKIASLRLLATSVIVTLGSILAVLFSIRGVFLCQFVLCLFTALLALILIKDANIPNKTNKTRINRSLKSQYHSFKNNLIEGLQTTLHLPILLGLLIGSTLAGSAQQIYSLVVQPALQDVGASLIFLGVVYSGFAISQSIGYYLGGKIPKTISEKDASFFIWFFAPVCYLVMFIGSTYSPIILSIGIIGYSFALGLYNPNMEQWYNKVIPDEHRTALLSLKSTIRNFAFSVTLLLSGFIIELTDKKIGFVMAVIMSSFVLIILKTLAILERRKQQEEESLPSPLHPPDEPL